MVLFIIGTLAALLLAVVSKATTQAHRAQCDKNMKAIILAVDAYRQETGRFPTSLDQLRSSHYIMDASMLRCPDDHRVDGSYAEYYAIRAPHDSTELPMLVCPFHEGNGRGAQAFLGRYTRQYSAAPARLTSANTATLEHPDGRGAIAAATGIELHGGDRIRTGNLGSATIQFQDGTTATLHGGADVTVLQSFIDGQSSGPLYTLVRQTLGSVNYQVNHGSKFDVVTPTATAGARGTAFEIRIDSDSRTNLLVTDGTVVLTTAQRTGVAPRNQWITDLNVLSLPLLDSVLNLLH